MPEELAAENERLRRDLAELEERSRQLADRLQELVTDSEARFAAIFREAAVGILLLDVRGRVAMANPAAARILGYSQQELRGAPASELWPAPEEVRLLRELIAGKRDKYRLERRFTRRDGTEVWASDTVSLIRSGAGDPEYALALLEDVTERKDAEEAARRLASEQAARAEYDAARRRIAFLAEASVALSSSLDPGATLDRLARLALPMLGDVCLVEVLEPDGSVRRVTEAAVEPSLEGSLKLRPRVSSRREGDPVVEVLRSGRTRLVTLEDAAPLRLEGPPSKGEGPASVLVVPLHGTGRTLGAIVFGRTRPEHTYSESDITLAEEFARRAALAMDNARLYQDAMEASRLKDDFLAVVSHELRTPLMPILGWAHLLRDEGVDRDVLSSGLETIERNARAQARLVDDLLDVSRIISGKLRIEAGPMALSPTIADALESLRPAARARGVELASVIEPAPRVLGDATRLLQVVWNLVSNAIKFTPAGGHVEVRLSRAPGRAVIQVRDTGQGIAPGFLPHLFQRFRQAEAATTRRHGGLGLGLSIVRHLVELHGGTVSADSPGPERGSTFTVSLPAAPGEELLAESLPLAASAPAASAAELAARLTGLRLLVVDDEPDTLSFLTQLLEGRGAKVTAATSAAEAFERLRARPPDVLVSDIGMPGEDGFSLIERIRALPATKGGGTPAIALTAFARSEDRVRALTAGFQSHVAKPVEPAELAAVIASLAPARRRRTRRR